MDKDTVNALLAAGRPFFAAIAAVVGTLAGASVAEQTTWVNLTFLVLGAGIPFGFAVWGFIANWRAKQHAVATTRVAVATVLNNAGVAAANVAAIVANPIQPTNAMIAAVSSDVHTAASDIVTVKSADGGVPAHAA